MRGGDLVDALKALADKLGVVVVESALESDGGLVQVKGRYRILVDRGLSPEMQAQVLAEALAGFDIEHVYIPPAVREAVEARRKKDSGADS